MKSYYTEGMKSFCESLFSNSKVSVIGKQITDLPESINNKFMHSNCISECTGKIAKIYIKKDDANCLIIKIKRDYLSFSKNERKILGNIPVSVNKSGFDWNQTRSEKAAQSLLARIAIPYVIISKFLRGSDSATIDTINNILLLIEELTNKKYEMEKCTSGIIYTSQINDTIKALKSQKDYNFIKFDEPIFFDNSFYNKPVSYRYIDGKNSFYLVDNSSRIYGIIKIQNPYQYSLIERLSGNHISKLIDSFPGRSWIAYNGINDDVCIYKRGNFSFSLHNNKWYYFDYENFELILQKYDINSSIVPIIIEICVSLSKLHKGSLILFPYSDNILPKITGYIDETIIASSIKKIFKKMKFDELFDSNILLNLLSSDGLSIFSKSGFFIDAGLIIDLSSKLENTINTSLDDFIDNQQSIKKIYGGGRTQSALVTSQYGLCIKISEDGPISIFYKKHCIYKMF